MNGAAADGTLTMKILVLNAGSSSQKSCLYEFEAQSLATPSRPLWEAEIDWTRHQGLAELKVATADGFGHQHFLHTALPKVRRVRQMIAQTNPDCELELDGGIDPETAPLGVEAGANVLVAGSAIFGAEDGVVAAMKRLRAAANQASN
jgi:ribulose-phosphate 3-epimerase